MGGPSTGDWVAQAGNDFGDWASDNQAGIAQGLLGATSLTSGLVTMSNQGLGLAGREQPSTLSYSGDYFNDARNARVQRLHGGELASGALKGAAAGTAIAPGIGTLIGAGVGAVGTIFASGRRRRRQQSEQNSAIDSALAYQGAYNTSQNTRDQQYTAASDYQRRADQYTQNLYNWTAI